MAHRVHPKIFRIKRIEDWDSRGFYGKSGAKLLEEDFKIRTFIEERVGKNFIEKIEIDRFPNKINVRILTNRPGLIIGRKGEEVEKLKKELDKILFKKIDVGIEIQPIKDQWLSAKLCAQWIAQQLENRIPYLRVMKEALQKIMAHKEVEGARIEVSGRLQGTEIARREWLKKGKLPRQTLKANIDFAKAQALCTYGVIGVKVWIYVVPKESKI